MSATAKRKAPAVFDAHHDNTKVGQNAPRDMPMEGDARLDEAQIEVVSGPLFKDHAEALMFNEELVTVMFHPTPDKNASAFVEVWVNGRSQFFIRGMKQTVKRKFIECAARGKECTYTQEEYKDARGNNAIRNIPSHTLKNPFSLLEDKNPRGGHAWMQNLLQEG